GARVPAQIQRMAAEEVLAAVFPDAAACLDNIQGARQLPEHPLVDQALKDCLEEAMDLPHLVPYLQRVFAGEVKSIARDTPEPSVFCHEILNSAAYTFLDDAPLEERRTRAVYTRRATEARSADDLGALDPQAIARVREEAWPTAGTADELHDALMLSGFLRAGEAAAGWRALLDELVAAGRAVDAGGYWVALERYDELAAVVPLGAAPDMPERLRRTWTAEDAARELVRARMEVLGPVTARSLADSLRLADTALVDMALAALEAEGRVLRGRFTPGADGPLEWCDRRLLARVHRYTLGRLRAEIAPVTAAELMRFLLHWQHVAEQQRVKGVGGLGARRARRARVRLRAADHRHAVPERPRRLGARHARDVGEDAAAQLADRADATRAFGAVARPGRRRPRRPELGRARGARGTAGARRIVLPRDRRRHRPAPDASGARARRARGRRPGHGGQLQRAARPARAFGKAQAPLAPARHADRRGHRGPMGAARGGRERARRGQGREDRARAARALRGGVPGAARARVAPAGMARARGRLPASRGPRRDPRRALRRRLRGRAVRAPGRRRPAPRGAQAREDRRDDGALRGRPAEPRRDRHAGSACPRDRGEPRAAPRRRADRRARRRRAAPPGALGLRRRCAAHALLAPLGRAG